MPFCTNCGHPIAPEVAFYAACGTEMDVEADGTDQSAQDPRRDLCSSHLRGEETLDSLEEMRNARR